LLQCILNHFDRFPKYFSDFSDFSIFLFLFYFQTFNLVKDSGLSMLYVESADDNVEQGDEEDHDRGRVVQDIGSLLVVGIVDVEPAKNEEEDAD